MEHVCRISRVVSLPAGHALLLGVGGGGKQSLARLAAHVAGVEVFAISVSSAYGMNEFRNDLLTLYNKVHSKGGGWRCLGVHVGGTHMHPHTHTHTHIPSPPPKSPPTCTLTPHTPPTQTGVKGIPTAFLLNDAQLVSDRFLVALNSLLAHGHVADLCGVEERDGFVGAVRAEAKSAGVLDTPDTLWQYFLSKVWVWRELCV